MLEINKTINPWRIRDAITVNAYEVVEVESGDELFITHNSIIKRPDLDGATLNYQIKRNDLVAVVSDMLEIKYKNFPVNKMRDKQKTFLVEIDDQGNISTSIEIKLDVC